MLIVLQCFPMDAEDKKKLDHMVQLVEENHVYIKKIHRSLKLSQTIKAVYWVIIIIFVLGGFYFLKPYLATLSNVYSTVSGKQGTGFQFPDAKQLQTLIEQYKEASK